jgi:hypothetical protein
MDLKKSFKMFKYFLSEKSSNNLKTKIIEHLLIN